MSTPTSPVPTLFHLLDAAVGEPVSSVHMQRYAQECSFHGGRNLHAVACSTIPDRVSTRTSLHGLEWTARAVYYRSPGAQALRIEVEIAPNADTGTYASERVLVTLPTGATWIAANGLDGSVAIFAPAPGRVRRLTLAGYADVSACAVGTFLEVAIKSTPTSASTSPPAARGIWRLSLQECPLGSLAPASDPTVPALDYNTTLYPAQIVDGGPSAAGGLDRLAYLLDFYRLQFRKHAQWIGVESADNTGTTTNPHWHTTSGTFADLEWQYTPSGSGRFPTMLVNLRKLYADKGPERWVLWVRYKTSTTGAATARLTVAAVGGSTWTYDLALAATNNVWTWASLTVWMPGDGTTEQVYATLQGKVTVAGQLLQVATAALIEAHADLEYAACTFDWGSATKPAPLTYTRSGNRWVIDDTAQTHLTKYTADAWGPERDSGGTDGHEVTAGYVNRLTAPRAYSGTDGNWTALNGTYAAFTATSPDGTALSGNHRATLTTGQTGAYYNFGSDTTMVFSAWARTPSGSGTWRPAVEHSSNGLYNVGAAFAITTAWSRGVVLSNATGGGKYACPAESNVINGSVAQDVVVDLLQVVTGLTYAPPFTDGTVGPDVQSVPGVTFCAAETGWWDVTLAGAVIAREAATTPSADHYLVWWDANNHLRLRQSDRKWVLTLAGVAVAVSGAQAFAAGTNLGAVRVWNLSTGCGFTINGVTTSAAAVAASVIPPTVYLFGDGTAAGVFPCRVTGKFLPRAV